MSSKISGDLQVTGNLRLGGSVQPGVSRTDLLLESLVAHPIPWTSWRVWDALQTNLPGTPATDDLGLVGGTFGTATPSLQTEDLNNAGATNNRARAIITLPPNFVAAGQVRLKFTAGMLTNPADTTATLDAEAYLLDGEAGITGSDLVSTSALSINSTTLAEKEFTVDGSSLSPGDQLDVRITTAINDAATGAEVKGIISYAALRCDIRG